METNKEHLETETNGNKNRMPGNGNQTGGNRNETKIETKWFNKTLHLTLTLYSYKKKKIRTLLME